MAYLVRKFSRSKWHSNEELPSKLEDIPSDAITSCLKTKDNEISLWKINDIVELNKVAIALSTSNDISRLNKIDLVYFKEDLLVDNFLLKESTGNTISHYGNMHRDLSNLTYEKLGKLANIILQSLSTNNVKRFTISDVKKEIERYISNNDTKKYLKNEDLEKIENLIRN